MPPTTCTARAGAEGDAISFACEEFAVSLPEIEAYIGHKVPYSPISPELIASVQLQPGTPREGGPPASHGRRGGGRPPARRRHGGPGGPNRRPGGR
jgi:ATP-dependent RNA helicase RhlB